MFNVSGKLDLVLGPAVLVLGLSISTFSFPLGVKSASAQVLTVQGQHHAAQDRGGKLDTTPAGHKSGSVFSTALNDALKRCRHLRKERFEDETLAQFLRRPNSADYYNCVEGIVKSGVKSDPLARMRWNSSKPNWSM